MSPKFVLGGSVGDGGSVAIWGLQIIFAYKWIVLIIHVVGWDVGAWCCIDGWSYGGAGVVCHVFMYFNYIYIQYLCFSVYGCSDFCVAHFGAIQIYYVTAHYEYIYIFPIYNSALWQLLYVDIFGFRLECISCLYWHYMNCGACKIFLQYFENLVFFI